MVMIRCCETDKCRGESFCGLHINVHVFLGCVVSKLYCRCVTDSTCTTSSWFWCFTWEVAETWWGWRINVKGRVPEDETGTWSVCWLAVKYLFCIWLVLGTLINVSVKIKLGFLNSSCIWYPGVWIYLVIWHTFIVYWTNLVSLDIIQHLNF